MVSCRVSLNYAYQYNVQTSTVPTEFCTLCTMSLKNIISAKDEFETYLGPDSRSDLQNRGRLQCRKPRVEGKTNKKAILYFLTLFDQLEVSVHNALEEKDSANVVGVVYGAEEPDR